MAIPGGASGRAELDGAGRTLRNVKVIFRARPDLPKALAANQGGRIVVDPKGDLFVTIGDRIGPLR
jgi:glucose/arabinose dehydrogenase